jgi:hypothetical protein
MLEKTIIIVISSRLIKKLSAGLMKDDSKQTFNVIVFAACCAHIPLFALGTLQAHTLPPAMCK